MVNSVRSVLNECPEENVSDILLQKLLPCIITPEFSISRSVEHWRAVLPPIGPWC